MFPFYEPPPTGVSLFWARVGTVAGIIGWLLLGIAGIVAPIIALIYHLTH